MRACAPTGQHAGGGGELGRDTGCTAGRQAPQGKRMGWDVDVDVDVDTTFGEPWAGPSLLQPSLRARRRTPHAARPWGLAATVDCLVVVVLPPVRQHPWRALQGCCPSSSRASEGGGRGRAAAARYGPPMEQVGGASPASASSGSTSAWSLYT